MFRIYITVMSLVSIFCSVLYSAGDAPDICKLIEEGKTKDVIILLDSNPNYLQLKNSGDSSLLHAAAKVGDASLITYLLKNGMDVNIKDNSGNTPLFEAVDAAKKEAVFLLIEKGADINISNKLQRTPIFYAARKKGNTDIVKMLAEKGSRLDFKSNLGMILLHIAVSVNDAEMVRYFLAKGLDVNVVDNRGRTPLMIAATFESCDIAKLLIEKGSDLNARHFNGNTPLMIAIDQGAIETVRYFLSRGAKTDIFNDQGSYPLHIAVQRGEAEFVEPLIKNSVNVNIRNIFTGATPLHIAASRGYEDLVLLLLTSGADPQLKNNDGYTPIDLAVKHGNKTSQRILSEFGAKYSSEVTVSVIPLMDRLGEGEARIWYLFHSGWAVKTKKALLIFDYYTGPPNSRAPDEMTIANGHINPEEIKGLDVYVFVSHIHDDHFNAKIFEWKKVIPNIKYILGFQYKESDDYTYAAPNKTFKIGDASVTTIYESADSVGYAVKIDGLTIFHGGDLSGWVQEMLDNLKAQADFLANDGIRPDMVFIFGAGWTMPYFQKIHEGLDYLFDKLKPAVFFPMHNGRMEMNNLMSAAQAQMHCKIPYAGIGLTPGDIFKYENGRLSPSPGLSEMKEFAGRFRKEFGEMKNVEENQDDISTIENLRKKDIEASLQGDTDTLLSLMTDDIILIYPDQLPIRGIDNIRKKMQSYKKELENIEIKQYNITFDELVIEGNLAYEWGSFHHIYFLKDKGREIEEKGRLMRILRKQPDGSWKVSRSIWNTNPN